MRHAVRDYQCDAMAHSVCKSMRCCCIDPFCRPHGSKRTGDTFDSKQIHNIEHLLLDEQLIGATLPNSLVCLIVDDYLD